MDLGVESWAYHRRFGVRYPWEPSTPVPPLDPVGFLAHVASLGVRHASLQTLFLPDRSAATADGLREAVAAHDLQLTLAWGHPDGLRTGTQPDRLDDLLTTLAFAEALSVRTVRIVCGDAAAWPEPVADRAERLVPMLRVAAGRAGEHGLRLAIENHGDLRMAELVALVERVGSPALGICFDNGNCLRVGDRPAVAAALAAPHVLMTHLKDLLGSAALTGDPTQTWRTVPLGRGDADPAATLDALGAAAAVVFVELSAMHPDYPDEDDAIREGLRFLRDYAMQLPVEARS